MLFQGAHTQDSHLSGSSTWGSASCMFALELSCNWERLFTAIPYMMWLGLSSVIDYGKLCCQPDLVLHSAWQVESSHACSVNGYHGHQH